MIVLWRTRSLTVTVSLMAWTRVPSQRSAVVQIVPRTVAAAYLPLVRNLPWALPRSSCRVFLDSAAVTTLPFLALQLAKLGAPLKALDTSATVVRPDRVWVTLKTAPPNFPDWVLAFLVFFLCLASVDSVACW